MIKLKSNSNRTNQSIKKLLFFALLSLSLLNSMSSFGDTYIRFCNDTSKDDRKDTGCPVDIVVREIDFNNSVSDVKKYSISKNSSKKIPIASEIRKMEVEIYHKGKKTFSRKFELSAHSESEWKYCELTKDGSLVKQGALDNVFSTKVTTHHLSVNLDDAPISKKQELTLPSMSSFGCDYLRLDNSPYGSYALNAIVRKLNTGHNLIEEETKYSMNKGSIENVKIEPEVKKVVVDLYKSGEETLWKRVDIYTIGSDWIYTVPTVPEVSILEKGSLGNMPFLDETSSKKKTMHFLALAPY